MRDLLPGEYETAGSHTEKERGSEKRISPWAMPEIKKNT